MSIPLERHQSTEADALFFSIGSGAISTDADGNISRINDAALEVIGRSHEEVIGKWFPDTVIATDIDGEVIQPFERAITRALMSGKSISERTFYRHSSGKPIPVYLTVSPIIVKGKPVGVVEVFRDISIEFEIDRLKTEFISIASHQLRTPATAVKNFIGLLRDGFVGELTPEQHNLIEQAYISNEHQLDIVNNLLYVARADSDAVNLKLAVHDLSKLAADCVLEQEPIIQARKQEVTTDIPDNITMVFDRQFIHMLIENLLTNASKYTPDGGHIKLKIEDSAKTVTIRVKDSGVGIAPEDISRLFKRFSRIENELSTIRGGSGIGLYLVKRVVDLHNGKVSITSKVDKGSEFKITLPKGKSNG